MYFVVVSLWFLAIINANASPVVQRRHQETFNLSQIDTLFSFGDSYTTQYLNLPTMTYPDSDKVSSTNGPNWVHYFTEAAKLKDWDLAYNSAPIENELVNQNSSVIDVDQQIKKLFPKYFLQNETYLPEKTLYDIWVGINDLGQLWKKEASPPMETLMAKLKELITFLSTKNAKYIVLINVPPIDRSPKYVSSGSALEMKNLVKEYNDALKTMADNVSQNKSIRIIFIDAWTIFSRMLDKPADYGFKNVTGYCRDWRHPEKDDCLPIKNYFWLNDLHPTTRVHEELAKEIQAYVGLKNPFLDGPLI